MARLLPLLVCCLFFQSHALMDNELIGNPEIKCNADTIEMQFRTKRIFTGKVYVKGHYNSPDCRVDYSHTNVEGVPTRGIQLHHGSCDMDRQRTIRPEGMRFSTVLVISFHPLFVTKMDRAFSINCLYHEASQTVTSNMEVSTLPTEVLHSDMPLPECTYTIRKDEIDGPLLKFANVGDQVVHRWECNSDVYGLLVHSCYVDDGQGNKHIVIDDMGCHTDSVLGDPTYVNALNMAYREGSAFKLADQVIVRFQCSIRLCLKTDGGCNDVTPPICEPRNASALAARRRRSAKKGPTLDTDLISQTMTVLDIEVGSPKFPPPERLQATSQRVCLSSAFFSVLVAFVAFLFIFITSSALYFYSRSGRFVKKLDVQKFAPRSPGFD
uniref:ZP domain-containing protein n=1 Tax=Steinernema glaseri TaxID=37863 RepID=A0A1I7Z323_9BILA